MKYLVFTLLSTFLYAHVPPAVNIDPAESWGQCGENNRAGMGKVFLNEYEAESQLRRQCLKSASAEIKQALCSDLLYLDQIKPDMHTLDALPEIGANLYFKNYAANIITSEMEIAGFPVTEVPKCLKNSAIELNVDRHEVVRRSAMEPDNVVSAIILMNIYGESKGKESFAPYIKRLTQSFPMLFKRKKKGFFNFSSQSYRSDELNKFIKQSLGTNFKYREHDGRDHKAIMTAYKAMYDNVPSFRKKLENHIKKIKQEYAKDMQEYLEELCSSSPMDIKENHPEIFDQAILDMNYVQRKAINNYLCSEKDYYQASKYDSDCDGISDKDDPAPSDRFVPNGTFHKKGFSVDNPPYAQDYDYKIDKQGENISLTTNLTLSGVNIDKKGKLKLQEQIQKCNSELEKSINDSYDFLKHLDEGFTGQVKTKVTLEFSDNKQPSFYLHECFCSDCADKVVDPDSGNPASGFVNYIDHTKCWDELSKTQQQAVKAQFPKEGEKRWRNRANAENLHVGVSCHTIKHEIMHKFGLPDEYSDNDSYPYNKVACNMMGDFSTYEEQNRVEARHIETILRPVKCE